MKFLALIIACAIVVTVTMGNKGSSSKRTFQRNYYDANEANSDNNDPEFEGIIFDTGN